MRMKKRKSLKTSSRLMRYVLFDSLSYLKLLLDETTCLTMVKGKIKAQNDQILSVPVAETLQVIAQFTSKLLTKETLRGGNSQTPLVKVELKAFVDGLEPTEPIAQGYLMTYELKILH